MRVAVKVIHSHLAEDEDFRARFRREVAAARRVNGAFTALVVAADVDGPVPWIATTYVPGPSLSAVVSQRGPLALPVIAALAAGLAEGLNAVHEAGVIHRDLTPSNVLLSPDGPRIIDFGISAAIGATALTRPGETIGTPSYMSPEQATGRPMSPASDIFSLAAVLTFAARGVGPFGSGEPVAVLYRVAAATPDIDGVPAALVPLLSHCLAADPELRPTAPEFLGKVTTTFPRASLPIDWAQVTEAVPSVLAPRPVPGTLVPGTPQAALPGVARPAPALPPGRAAGQGRGRRGPVIASIGAAVLAAGAVIGLAASGTVFGRPGGPATSLTPSASGSASTSGVHAPAAPTGVRAIADGKYAITVSWAEGAAGVTGFRIDNHCLPGACPPGGSLARVTGLATSTTFTVTPGSRQCFRVRALSRAGDSAWTPVRCAQTPGLAVSAAAQWVDTGVTVPLGIQLIIRATGTVNFGPFTGSPMGPNGSDCGLQDIAVPPFLARGLTCWSLVGRIGSASPFEVGAADTFTTTAAGRLYLAGNDTIFTDNTGSWTVDIQEGGLPAG
jgi:hypothetical protein